MAVYWKWKCILVEDNFHKKILVDVFYHKILGPLIIFYLHCTSRYVRVVDGLSIVPVLDMQHITS